MKGCLGLIFAMVGIVLAAPMANAARGNDLVKVTVLADVSAIQPGKPFMLGFKFSIEPKWHIYWKNPGDSGLATQIKLNLPPGFTAGELMFPVPKRLQLPGDVINYAYENEVMLMVQVLPPSDLPIGGSITISAKASFLVCNEVCIPGNEQTLLNLPVATTAVHANVDEFKIAASRLPVKSDPFDVASVESNLEKAGDHLAANTTVVWGKTVADVMYLPELLTTGEAGDIKITSTAGRTVIMFDVKGAAASEAIKGLLIFTSSDGAQKGLQTVNQ